jgi:tetratricopeptide (TPR) repeat protein
MSRLPALFLLPVFLVSPCRLWAQQAGLRLSGIVTDARTHTAIAGARISAVGGTASHSAVSDAKGTFILLLAGGIKLGDTVRIRIEKPGYTAYDEHVTVSADLPLQIELSPSRSDRAPQLPEPFRSGEVGILIAEARGDENHERQTAYQAAILHAIEATPELRDIVKVRLLENMLSADIEKQQTEALRFGRLLHASFVLQPNAVAGFEEPWITIVDQPAFTSSHASMGSFATVELAQPDNLRLPRDVLQLAKCTLALLLYRQHEYEAVLKNLDDLFNSPDMPEAAPSQADLRVLYGNTLLGVGRISEGEIAYREAIKLDARTVEGHSNLGWALGLQGQFDESADEARKAIELRPSLADAHVTLGVAMAHSGRLDEGIAEYKVSFANTLSDVLYDYVGGQQLENNIWNNFMDNVQGACSSSGN